MSTWIMIDKESNKDIDSRQETRRCFQLLSSRVSIPELLVSCQQQPDNDDEDGSCESAATILGTPFLHRCERGDVPSLRGIERCAREFRRVFSTSCIVYLAPFTRLLAGIDYLAITVFRIVRGHSCLSVVPFSPFLSPVMAPTPRPLSLTPSFSPCSRPLVLFFSILARSSAPLRPTRSLQEFFAQQRAYRYGIMQR